MHLESAGFGRAAAGAVALWIEPACGVWTRLRGLIGRPAPGVQSALLLPRCRSVHTFWMSYPIDVVFVDRAMTVTAVFASVAARRVARDRRAWGALELRAGEARRLGLVAGTIVAARRVSCHPTAASADTGRR